MKVMKKLFKDKLKAIVLLVCSLIFFANTEVYAQRDKEPEPLKYEIYSAGVGAQGTYLVRVHLYTKRVRQVNDPDLKKAAIHGVLFRGFAPLEKGGVSQKPIILDPSVESENAEYFTEFFSNSGRFSSYVNIVPKTYEVVKGGKKAFKYKICVTVQVHKDALRQEMERNGIVKSLSNVFNK